MKTNEVKTKRVHNLIIVDESGSMEVIRKQAFVGMNETLQTVRQMQKKYPDQVQLVTLLTFDSGHTTWHYDNASALKTSVGKLITLVAERLSMMPLAKVYQKSMPKLRTAIMYW